MILETTGTTISEQSYGIQKMSMMSVRSSSLGIIRMAWKREKLVKYQR